MECSLNTIRDLEQREVELYLEQKDASIACKKARDDKENALQLMNDSWTKLENARDIEIVERENLKAKYAARDKVWGKYGQYRDDCNKLIAELKKQADNEHSLMVECFDRAKALEEENPTEAETFREEARMHHSKRNQLNNQITELIGTIRQHRQEAESIAPRPSDEDYRRARDARMDASKKHDFFRSEYLEKKTKYNEKRAELERVRDEHNRVKILLRKTIEARQEETGYIEVELDMLLAQLG